MKCVGKVGTVNIKLTILQIHRIKTAEKQNNMSVLSFNSNALIEFFAIASLTTTSCGKGCRPPEAVIRRFATK